jgi:hypothetical protein
MEAQMMRNVEKIEMTLDEEFNQSPQWFKEFEKDFPDNQFRFLKSIQHYRLRNTLTKKQMTAFISIVDSIMWNKKRRK